MSDMDDKKQKNTKKLKEWIKKEYQSLRWEEDFESYEDSMYEIIVQRITKRINLVLNIVVEYKTTPARRKLIKDVRNITDRPIEKEVEDVKKLVDYILKLIEDREELKKRYFKLLYEKNKEEDTYKKKCISTEMSKIKVHIKELKKKINQGLNIMGKIPMVIILGHITNNENTKYKNNKYKKMELIVETLNDIYAKLNDEHIDLNDDCFRLFNINTVYNDYSIMDNIIIKDEGDGNDKINEDLLGLYSWLLKNIDDRSDLFNNNPQAWINIAYEERKKLVEYLEGVADSSWDFLHDPVSNFTLGFGGNNHTLLEEIEGILLYQSRYRNTEMTMNVDSVFDQDDKFMEDVGNNDDEFVDAEDVALLIDGNNDKEFLYDLIFGKKSK